MEKAKAFLVICVVLITAYNGYGVARAAQGVMNHHHALLQSK